MAKKPTEEDTAPLAPADEAAAAEIAAMTPTEAPKGISEEDISEKTRAGLTRDQAIEVITSQRAWDKSQKK
jgi:hypothetical protein